MDSEDISKSTAFLTVLILNFDFTSLTNPLGKNIQIILSLQFNNRLTSLLNFFTLILNHQTGFDLFIFEKNVFDLFIF